MVKLAVLTSHPIQYQAPLFRKISQQPGIDLKVFFLSDFSVRNYKNAGFGRTIKWDVPLLDGYDYEVLPAHGPRDRVSFFRPFNYGLFKRLKKGRFDALLLYGYAHHNNILAILVAKKLGVKVFLIGDSNLIITRSPLKLFLKKVILKWLFNKCDGFFSIGTLNKEYYIHYGVPEESIFDMPFAVDNLFFQKYVKDAKPDRKLLRASLGLKPGIPVILFASKMIPIKRSMDLFEAYIRLSKDQKQEPNPYLVYIGDGEDREELEAKAKKTGWNSIKFLGFQNQSQLPAFFDLCDVFVLPSTHEPWGLIINEAMNAGKPVIVSDQVGCAPDLVRDGENGFIFPAKDVPALSRALEKIFSNPKLAKEMGEKSLIRINNWSYENDLQGLRDALQSIIR